MINKALVVVVSYNNVDLTRRAIQALQEQTFSTTIVLWDNASTDGTVDWLRSRNKADIYIEQSEENVLWTPAINRSIEKYWSDEMFIGYMNNDAAPLRTTVARLVEHLRRPEVGLVGPSMEHIGGPQDIAFCAGHDIVARGTDIEVDMEKLSPKRVTYLLGAFAMLRKEVWDEVGPLDEDMPLGADDHDYAIRLKAKGYQLLVAQDAFCRHKGHASESTKAAERLWRDWGAKSWNHFNTKWAGYYATEEEALKCHWVGDYQEGWDVGTGWEGRQGPDKDPESPDSA